MICPSCACGKTSSTVRASGPHEECPAPAENICGRRAASAAFGKALTIFSAPDGGEGRQKSQCLENGGAFFCGGGARRQRGSGPWKRRSLKSSRTKPCGGAGLLRTGIAIALPAKPSVRKRGARVRRRRVGGSARRGDDAAARAGGRNGQDRPLPHGRTFYRRFADDARPEAEKRRRCRWCLAHRCRQVQRKMRSARRGAFFPLGRKKRCVVSFLLSYRDVDEARAKDDGQIRTGVRQIFHCIEDPCARIISDTLEKTGGIGCSSASNTEKKASCLLTGSVRSDYKKTVGPKTCGFRRDQMFLYFIKIIKLVNYMISYKKLRASLLNCLQDSLRDLLVR